MKPPNVLSFAAFIGIAAAATLLCTYSSYFQAAIRLQVYSRIQEIDEQTGSYDRNNFDNLTNKPGNNMHTAPLEEVNEEGTSTRQAIMTQQIIEKIHQTDSLSQRGQALRKTPTHSYTNIRDESNITIKIIYRDLTVCEPRPDYFPAYRAHCWADCKSRQQCNSPPTMSDVRDSKALMFCFPNLHLIGTRKSATTDFSTLWIPGLQEVQRTQQDYFGDAEICPVNYMRKRIRKKPDMLLGSIYNGGPGTLLANIKVFKNETHLMISSGIQFISYMSTPDSRFYLQLRNPTDRAISYLFHWQREKRIPQFKTLSRSAFTETFVDKLIRRLMAELKNCIARHGEVACLYLPDAHDGNLDVLLTHSLYVLYIEEMFKFIPREQVMVKTMEEYSKDRESTATEVIKNFFGVNITRSFKGKGRGKVMSRGQKNPVLPATLELLDDFFAPYNQRLSDLLGDQKFLFTKERVWHSKHT